MAAVRAIHDDIPGKIKTLNQSSVPITELPDIKPRAGVESQRGEKPRSVKTKVPRSAGISSVAFSSRTNLSDCRGVNRRRCDQRNMLAKTAQSCAVLPTVFALLQYSTNRFVLKLHSNSLA